jgi:hypothetical protein
MSVCDYVCAFLRQPLKYSCAGKVSALHGEIMQHMIISLSFHRHGRNDCNFLGPVCRPLYPSRPHNLSHLAAAQGSSGYSLESILYSFSSRYIPIALNKFHVKSPLYGILHSATYWTLIKLSKMEVCINILAYGDHTDAFQDQYLSVSTDACC